MFYKRAVLALCLLSATIALADILVNVNVNKPIHDVSEQFVSFSIPPELLYGSLDGKNKKTLTEMAALLGPSYVKLTGDYFFPTDFKSTLKNPTQSIWSGFNRWTRAMNWTMVIPVQYTPLAWDPIEALRVLNISNTIGLDNCIWQLGLDFGASRAADYVADLHTLDTMVDTFRPYVKEWKVIGADVTAGSSAEETKRYIDMSSDVNAAFGWNQPAGYHVEENVNGYIYDKDVSLKAMMEKKVPVWLSLPPKSPINQLSNGYTSMEVSEGIRWAQTLGDAASSGFSAVFKPLTEEDVSSPTYSFFVSALYKKVMGNRVFAAKPVKRLSYSSKVYTHCANGISGGIAFMGINTEEYVVKISAKPSAKFTGSEVWQFILTSKKGVMYLNNEELTLNSTLDPFVRIKHPNKPLAMNLPPMSVGFWVLPLANHEDCQFTELLTNAESHWENRHRRQTSSDRLLKKLILDTSLTDQMKNRRRRDTSSNTLNKESSSAKANQVTRHKRFILQETPGANPVPPKVNPKIAAEERKLKKREDAQNWLKSLVLNPVLSPVLNPVLLPKVEWGHKRTRRDTTDFLSAMFSKATSGKSILRRQSLPTPKQKPIDEESIFKTSNVEINLPEGDVHFDYITNTNGEEISTKENRGESAPEKETKMPNREFPSEFYEAIDHGKYMPKSFEYKSITKPKVSDISDIEGQTKYITRNQLESHYSFENTQKEQSKPFHNIETFPRPSKTKSPFGTDVTLTQFPFLESEDLNAFENTQKEYETPSYKTETFPKTTKTNSPFSEGVTLKQFPYVQNEDLNTMLYEPDENDALQAYLNAAKSVGEWSPAVRTRRSILGFNKYKTFSDNIITQDDRVLPLSQDFPRLSETTLEESVLGAEGRVGAAAETVKSKVSEFVTVVKDHINNFLKTLIS